MITFDINGANVEFDEKMSNYNSIRKLFKLYAQDSAKKFEEECFTNLLTIKQISDKGLNIGNEIIEEILKKAIETIVSYDVITIDLIIFKETYCQKYLNYKRLFNNLNKESLIPNKNKKNNQPKINEIKTIIKKLSDYIYNDCFNVHYAIVDALIENGVNNVHIYIDESRIKKSNALFNNYKDGFITRPDEYKVVKQIIELNPYREDVYEFLIKEDGDFAREIEKLTDFLGYETKTYKSTLMDIYIKELIENDHNDIEILKEKVKKYAKYIGCSDSTIYIARIDAIYSFENA